MRITKRQLRRIIKEEMITHVLPVPAIGTDDKEISEVGMAINQLQAIAAIALELSEQIREMDYVPEWGQAKIAVGLGNLNDISTYLLGKNLGQ
jgi:hypothetical protein